ncbi:unnamed protein product [Calicophoron daubneyi]|uniref:Serine-threonine kinase receptor-associated protein n=1 Tax=Calicophoron daubneyi TaxID=300641 RepID=A0AAV2TBI2_CALDB
MASSLKQAPIACPGHSRPVVDIYFSDDADCGALFLTVAKDGRAILRQGDTGDWIGTFLGHQGAAIWSCALDAYATKAATGAADFTAKMWDTTSGQELLSLAEEHIVRCVDMSKSDSGGHLLTANNLKKLSVYDLSAPSSPLIRFDAHEDLIRRGVWSNGDRNIVTASEDKTVRLWDVSDRSKRPVASTSLWSIELDKPVTDLQFKFPNSPESSTEVQAALVFGRNVELYTFDWRRLDTPATPKPTASFTLPCTMFTVSLSPTDDTLVCGGEDHYLYRLDCKSGKILETCKGHFGPVHCVRFSPGGHVFVSGSEDGTVRMWQAQVGENFGLWQLSVPVTTNGLAAEGPNGSAPPITTGVEIPDAGHAPSVAAL